MNMLMISLRMSQMCHKYRVKEAMKGDLATVWPFGTLFVTCRVVHPFGTLFVTCRVVHSVVTHRFSSKNRKLLQLL